VIIRDRVSDWRRGDYRRGGRGVASTYTGKALTPEEAKRHREEAEARAMAELAAMGLVLDG